MKKLIFDSLISCLISCEPKNSSNRLFRIKIGNISNVRPSIICLDKLHQPPENISLNCRNNTDIEVAQSFGEDIKRGFEETSA